MSEKPLLKDQLFNSAKVTYLAELISKSYPKFSQKEFIRDILDEFPHLELKARIACIRKYLQRFLPDDFETAVHILIQSLPPPLDVHNKDNDFGDFIFAPFSDFVAHYGCNEKYRDFSLNALERITQNFSAEDAIRFFLRKFPEQTLLKMEEWSQNINYHVRRLASEGTRPKLPWSHSVDLENYRVISTILENLYRDDTRYVIRSVANHLNDISKDDSDCVIDTLIAWKRKQTLCDDVEFDYLCRHSLRTLVKKGNRRALEFLGYSYNASVFIINFSVDTPVVHIGGVLRFSGEIISEEEKPVDLMIDYSIYFVDTLGKRRPKVFKLKKIRVFPREKIEFFKNHTFRIMTTKKLYSGLHYLEIQINGKVKEKRSFDLVV